MTLYAFLTDFILIAAGYLAHRKWKENGPGFILMVVGGFLLVIDLYLGFIK